MQKNVAYVFMSGLRACPSLFVTPFFGEHEKARRIGCAKVYYGLFPLLKVHFESVLFVLFCLSSYTATGRMCLSFRQQSIGREGGKRKE